jgi:hypothetical protein
LGSGCSHLYYAVQLIMMLVLLAVVSTQEYVSSTWGAWLVVLLLIPVIHVVITLCSSGAWSMSPFH